MFRIGLLPIRHWYPFAMLEVDQDQLYSDCYNKNLKSWRYHLISIGSKTFVIKNTAGISLKYLSYLLIL